MPIKRLREASTIKGIATVAATRGIIATITVIVVKRINGSPADNAGDWYRIVNIILVVEHHVCIGVGPYVIARIRNELLF